MSTRICSIKGCAHPVRNRGWCSTHYQRWCKHGDANYDRAAHLASAVPARFWAKVERDEGGCWRWLGVMNDSGYGLLGVGARNVRAHRLSWELHNTPVPDGMQVDHMCRNRGCVNPSHLRLASPKQNSEHTDARPGSLSRFRGVSFNKARGKWVAQVNDQGRNHAGGYFETEDEAATAARDLRNSLYTHNNLDRRIA